VGYDNVDIKAAAELGIRVSNVPDYGVDEVADSTFFLLLSLMRKASILSTKLKIGEWSTKDASGSTRLQGKTIGLVGLGRIGTAVALR
jgi:lactate dehydrogenase-like 2-hydroxyacid dehydrogenase